MASDFFKNKIAPLKKFKRRLAGIGGSLTTKLRHEIGRRKMDATGGLRKSLKHKTSFKSGFQGVQIELTMQGYGGFLNRNLYPKMKSATKKKGYLEAIENWMEVKGIAPGKFSNGRRMTKRQAAFVIARAISENGFKTFNDNQKVGWLDFVFAKETQRLGAKVNNWTKEAMTEIDNMKFNFLKKQK